jgi:hypothetical protein
MQLNVLNSALEVHLVATSENGNTMLESQLARLKNGELFCTWTTGHHYEPHVKTYTMCARSSDGGKHWYGHKILFQHPYQGIYTPCLFQDEDGTLYAFFCTYCWPGSRIIGSYYQSFVSRADPDALHWTIPRRYCGAVDGLAVKQACRHEGKLYLAASYFEPINDKWPDPDLDWHKPCIVDGRNISKAEFNYMGRGDRYAVSIFESEDNAESFRRISRRFLRTENSFGFGEPTLTRLSDGSFIMLFRTEEPRIFFSRSADLISWSDPEIFPGLPTPPLGAKVWLTQDKEGVIYLFLKNGYDKYAPLSCFVSRDDMKSFCSKVDLFSAENPFYAAYPSVFIDESERKLHMSFDNHIAEVYYASISLDALQNG